MPPRTCYVCTRPVPDTNAPTHPQETELSPNTRPYCSALCRDVGHLQGAGTSEAYSQDTMILERANRAGEIAQLIFYAFLENTWAYDLSSVRVIKNKEGDIVEIETIEGPGLNNSTTIPSPCERYAGGWLIKFPHEAFWPAHRNLKEALLARHSSVWAFVFMQKVIQLLFQDLVDDTETDVKEVVHYLPSNTKSLVQNRGRYGFSESSRNDLAYCDNDGTGYLKGVYRVTLKTGVKIAVDLAGAQFNLNHVTVIPWLDYLNRWASNLKYRVPLGSHYTTHITSMNNYKHITYHTLLLEQLSYLNNLVTDLESFMGIDLQNISAEQNEAFRDYTLRLMIAVDRHLQKRPVELDTDLRTDCIIAPFDLRHPQVSAEVYEDALLPLALPTFDSMNEFDWNLLRKSLQTTGSKSMYKEKKKTRDLLQHRCVYQMPGDGRLVFLRHDLPSSRVPSQCVRLRPS